MSISKKGKIVVGMSGGVDSSMSLVMLKKDGWDPIGVSLKYAVWKDPENKLKENVCCDAESFRIAKNICKELDVPHYIFNVSKEFEEGVIDYFIKDLKNNLTPNPCVVCNRYLKFKKLFEWAHKHNIENIATGHYASINYNQKTGKYTLARARDKSKDQTYSLSFLPQRWLKNIIFPLANHTKDEIFKMAEENGFGFYLKRKQSQDFCFVANKCLSCFLKKEIGEKEGLIKDIKGNVLGKHHGLHFYTIGQRKGINLPGGPYFVANIDTESNTLIVTKEEKDLLSKEVFLSPYHFISGDKELKEEIKVKAKIRSQHNPAKATLIPVDTSKIKINFDKPQRAITPGQFIVFYQDDICLGAGKILTNKKQ